MATRIDVVQGMAAGAGMNPMTVERSLRVLGTQGLIPAGGIGRRTAHFSAAALANVVLALGATQPSEAAKAVRVFGELRCNTDLDLNLGKRDAALAITIGTTLQDWVKGMVERLADPPEVQRLLTIFSGAGFYSTLMLSLSVDGLWATVGAPGSDIHDACLETFGSTERPPCHRRVDVLIDLHVLIAAGKLLADTIARQSMPIPDPVPGSTGEGDATPETTKASGTGIHEGLQSKHPAPKAQAATVNKVQSATDKGSKQRLPDLGTPRSQVRRQPVGVRHHGAHRTDTASSSPR